MIEITKRIQEIATRLLSDGEVDIFIAWEKGPFAYQTKPYLAHTVEDVDKIVFDEYADYDFGRYYFQCRR